MLIFGGVLPRKLTSPPKNQWLEDAFPIEIVPLGDMLVFRGANPFSNPHLLQLIHLAVFCRRYGRLERLNGSHNFQRSNQEIRENRNNQGG